MLTHRLTYLTIPLDRQEQCAGHVIFFASLRQVLIFQLDLSAGSAWLHRVVLPALPPSQHETSATILKAYTCLLQLYCLHYSLSVDLLRFPREARGWSQTALMLPRCCKSICLGVFCSRPGKNLVISGVSTTKVENTTSSR
jgi:hypothetical protein